MNPRPKTFRHSATKPAWIPDSWFVPLLIISIGTLAFLEWKFPSSAQPIPDVYISEIAATGMNSIEDEDGELVNWLEIANFGKNPIGLKDWKLTDDFRAITRWSFPDVTLAPGERILVHASGKDRRQPGRPLHTNFKLHDHGEYVALLMPNGRTTVHEILPKYPRQHGRETWGLMEETRLTGAGGKVPADAYRFFEHPTPGTTNSNYLYGHVAEVNASHPSGVRNESFTLVLSCRTAGARILYTTDGSQPNATNSQRYLGPLSIKKSTIVRATALREGWAGSEIMTRSFLFPRSTLDQSGKGWPVTWGNREGAPVPADYEMDREIITNPAYTKDLLQGLFEIPTVSLVIDPHDLFNPETGIYSNPMETGVRWERPAVMEVLHPTSGRDIRIQCGLRIQGGWNRRPEECPKHSLRVLFKREYGGSKLSHQLFAADGPQDYETLILRGGCNNTWLHWSGEERQRGDYLRDQWMRETAAAMGHVASRGRFVHVYLNGLYWGLYNLAERPSSPMLASIAGAPAEDFDSRNAEKVLSGDDAVWKQLFEIANNGLATNAPLDKIRPLLDLENFCDYMLLNFYGANADWDRSSNWYAARRNNPPGPYQFLVWDGERTLENVSDDRMDFSDDQSPPGLFHKLSKNSAFRELFQSRVRIHCGPGGALAPKEASDRFARLARTIENAIVAESARWGDYRRDVHSYKTGPYTLYTRDDHWKPEIQRLLNEYFPKRTAYLLKLLRKRGLAPTELGQD